MNTKQLTRTRVLPSRNDFHTFGALSLELLYGTFIFWVLRIIDISQLVRLYGALGRAMSHRALGVETTLSTQNGTQNQHTKTRSERQTHTKCPSCPLMGAVQMMGHFQLAWLSTAHLWFSDLCFVSLCIHVHNNEKVFSFIPLLSEIVWAADLWTDRTARWQDRSLKIYSLLECSHVWVHIKKACLHMTATERTGKLYKERAQCIHLIKRKDNKTNV